MRTRPEDIYLEGMEFEPDVVEWMKQHKVREIKALAKEVEEHGEDASELKEFYKELKKIEKEWHQIVSKEEDAKRMPPAV